MPVFSQNDSFNANFAGGKVTRATSAKLSRAARGRARTASGRFRKGGSKKKSTRKRSYKKKSTKKRSYKKKSTKKGSYKKKSGKKKSGKKKSGTRYCVKYSRRR